jgi:hypothetical protein
MELLVAILLILLGGPALILGVAQLARHLFGDRDDRR